MKKYWVVMSVMSFEKALSVTSPFGVSGPCSRPAEPPYYLLPVFETKEQAEAWLGDDKDSQIIECEAADAKG
ncbi:MAG: hypothetical protein R8K20_11300 [Gallionellaceae bacterium]